VANIRIRNSGDGEDRSPTQPVAAAGAGTQFLDLAGDGQMDLVAGTRQFARNRYWRLVRSVRVG
jgi:hypothetical protein